MDDEIWHYYRKEATKWAIKRDQSFRSSQNAYNRGDGLKAKNDSNLGKHYKKLCDEANKSAANAIFIQMNENRPLTEIDLHGLFVNEAIEKLEDRVIYAINNGVHELDVIVGQGHHSEDGPKIKPSVVMFAENNNIPYIINERNAGCIQLIFGRSGEISPTTTERKNKIPMRVHPPTIRSEYLMTNRQESSSLHRETTESSYILVCIWLVLVFFAVLKLLGFL